MMSRELLFSGQSLYHSHCVQWFNMTPVDCSDRS